jgi:Fic family protein
MGWDMSDLLSLKKKLQASGKSMNFINKQILIFNSSITVHLYYCRGNTNDNNSTAYLAHTGSIQNAHLNYLYHDNPVIYYYEALLVISSV